MKGSILNWVRLLRVKHWIKNTLVLFPLIFSGQLFSTSAFLLKGIVAFFAFSFGASVIYILNDIKDINNDRNHPTKCARPLAANLITKNAAIIVAIILLIISLLLTLAIAEEPLYSSVVLFSYLVLNCFYSCGAKNVPIIDIAILAAGFVLRVIYGGTFCDIPISSWLFLTVLVLAFYFALGKRRGELKKHGSNSRASLKEYSESYLEKMMYVFLACGFVFYSLWTFERLGSLSPTFNLGSMVFIAGIPLAMIICMRYSLDIESDSSDGDPVEVVFADKLLLVLIILWFLIVVISICGSMIF